MNLCKTINKLGFHIFWVKPKFGPLPHPSRDSICMPSQVWSTDFVFEIFDHVINSRLIRSFGPYSNSSNSQVWSTSNRKVGPNLRIRTNLMPRDHKLFEFAGLIHSICSNCTKPAYSTKIYNVTEEVVDQTWNPV